MYIFIFARSEGAIRRRGVVPFHAYLIPAYRGPGHCMQLLHWGKITACRGVGQAEAMPTTWAFCFTGEVEVPESVINSGPSSGWSSGCVLSETFVVSHPAVTLKLHVSLDYQVLVAWQIWNTLWLFPDNHSHMLYIRIKSLQPFHHVSNGAAFVLACLMAIICCCSQWDPLCFRGAPPHQFFDSFSGTSSRPLPMLIFPCPSCIGGIASRTILPYGDLKGPNSQICSSVTLPDITQGAVWEICNKYKYPSRVYVGGEKTAKPKRIPKATAHCTITNIVQHAKWETNTFYNQ